MEMVELEDRALSTLEMVELEDRALSTLTRCIKLLAVLLSLLACISFAVTLRTVSGGEKEGGEGTNGCIHFDPDEDVDSRLLREEWERADMTYRNKCDVVDVRL